MTKFAFVLMTSLPYYNKPRELSNSTNYQRVFEFFSTHAYKVNIYEHVLDCFLYV